MARRSAPAGSGPAYISARPSGPSRPHGLDIDIDDNESEWALKRWVREQVFAPEQLPGNLSVLTGLVVFFGGVAAVRTWGEMMIPA